MSTYDFNIETKDGASHGLMEGQPALPERGDILQMWGQQGQAVYWQVLRRRFVADSNRIVVVVEPRS